MDHDLPQRVLTGLRSIGGLVHGTQRERGATTVYLATAGATFSSQLAVYRSETDVRLAEALNLATSLPTKETTATAEFQAALQMISRLGPTRIRIDNHEITTKEAIEFHTDLNEAVLAVSGVFVDQVVHVETRARMVSLLALMRAKELAGVELAVLAQAFAEDTFPSASMLWTVSLLTAQEVLLRIAEHTAGETSRNLLARLDEHPAVIASTELETLVLTNGLSNFGVDPNYWFEQMATRIDLLKGIEDNELEELDTVVAEIGIDHHKRAASVDEALTATVLAMRNLRGQADQVRKGESPLRDFVRSRGDALTAAEQKLATALQTEELAAIARRDDLTGLLSRSAVEGLLDAALQRKPWGSRRVAVMMLDLDHFKAVNDSMGHYAGDELLQAVADRLRRTVRSCDTIARVGGDEFVIVSEPFESLERTVMVAERILDYVAVPYQIQGREVRVSVSIGIAVATEQHTTADLLRDSDLAAYRAKAAGRGRISIYDDDMRSDIVSMDAATQRLRAGLQANEIVAWFQPIIDIKTGDIVATEALARWDNGTKIVTAGEFIPAAQQAGLLPEIDEAILQSVLDTRPLFGEHAPAVSLNVSDLQLRQPRFANDLFDQVTSRGVSPHDVWIEITEHLPLSSEVAVSNLHRLRHIGFTIVLDDFGSGFSALSVLQTLPIDVLKLDGLFIKDLEHDKRTRVIVESIVRIASTLGMRTVAESVESQTQLTILGELGCDMAQGFFIARPGPPGDISGSMNPFASNATSAR